MAGSPPCRSVHLCIHALDLQDSVQLKHLDLRNTPIDPQKAEILKQWTSLDILIVNENGLEVNNNREERLHQNIIGQTPRNAIRECRRAST